MFKRQLLHFNFFQHQLCHFNFIIQHSTVQVFFTSTLSLQQFQHCYFNFILFMFNTQELNIRSTYYIEHRLAYRVARIEKP